MNGGWFNGGVNSHSSLDRQFNDFRPELPPRYMNSGDRNRQLESTRTGTARIEKQDALAHLDRGAMRVAIHDRCITNGRRVQGKLRNVMQHVEQKFADLDIGSHWQRVRPMRPIHVSTHDERRCQLAERIDHIGSPDVTRMDNEIRSLERRDGLWPKQSVRIGDHPDKDFVSAHDPARVNNLLAAAAVARIERQRNPGTMLQLLSRSRISLTLNAGYRPDLHCASTRTFAVRATELAGPPGPHVWLMA